MRRFALKNKEIFEILAKAIAEGIVIVNESQQIIACNAAANEMFGYAPEELKGENLNILLPERYRAAHKTEVYHFIKNGKKRQMGHGRDLYAQRKDGSNFPVEASLNPLDIDGRKYVMSLITDISVRKKHEERILKLNAQLEKQVADRTQDLKETIGELKEEITRRREAEYKIKENLRKERELGELKTKFLSMVSHEFKTPLSAILTSVTLAKKYTRPDQQQKREKHLNTITHKVKYLNSILNDFLSIRRLESGKISYKKEDFPLYRLINNVIYDSNMQSKEGQKITYPENIDNLIVHYDEKILETALTNLINNSIKYSSEDSTIEVSVDIKPDNLRINVRDEGIGIPKEEQKFIFKPYFRAENASIQQGTGIGLNIVKNHLENLNGTITFQSKEGEGSIFSIEIPYNHR